MTATPIQAPTTEHDQLVVARAELRASFRREVALEKSYRLVAQATSRQQKTINRYHDLLAKVGKSIGEHHDKCSGTGCDLTGIDPELTASQIRDRMDEWPGQFLEDFPDDCADPHCFDGFVVSP